MYRPLGIWVDGPMLSQKGLMNSTYLLLCACQPCVAVVSALTSVLHAFTTHCYLLTPAFNSCNRPAWQHVFVATRLHPHASAEPDVCVADIMYDITVNCLKGQPTAYCGTYVTLQDICQCLALLSQLNQALAGAPCAWGFGTGV